MNLTIAPPSGVNATPAQSDNVSDFKLHFYRGRLSLDGPLITVVDDKGEVLDRVLLRVSRNGKLSINRLVEELDDTTLAAEKEEKDQGAVDE